MEVQLTYNVPVMVHVDTDTGEVTRVVVIDEGTELGSEARDFDTWELLELGSNEVVWATEMAEALPWPEWEHGY